MTPADLLTLIIAALALVASVISLVWQFITWRNSGPVLNVSAMNVITQHPATGTLHGVAVQADNKGRAGTVVQQCGFQVSSGGIMVNLTSWQKPVTLPASLGPGESFDFWYDSAELKRACVEKGVDPSNLRPFVKTGHGTTVGEMRKLVIDAINRATPAP